MVDQNKSPDQQGTAAKQALAQSPLQSISEPVGASKQGIDSSPSAASSDQEIKKATAELDSIRRGELWIIGINSLAVIVAFAVCLVYYFQLQVMKGQLQVMRDQLSEMKSGSADTHELAVQAKNQADRTKDVANRALSQANATANLATEARRSADASEKGLAILRQQFTSDQRPYIFVAHVEPPTFKEGERASWNIIFQNYGKSPAIGMMARAQVFVNKPGVKPDESLFEADFHKGMEWTTGRIIPPGIPNDYTTAKSLQPLTKDDIDFVNSVDGGLVVIGRMEYFDIRGNRYHTEYCLFRLISNALANCDYHSRVE